jgi:hypothetical protein
VRLFWSEAESPKLRAIRGAKGAVAPRFAPSGAARESRPGMTALGRLPGLTRAYDDHSDRRRPESPVVTGDLPTSVLAVPVPPEESRRVSRTLKEESCRRPL